MGYFKGKILAASAGGNKEVITGFYGCIRISGRIGGFVRLPFRGKLGIPEMLQKCDRCGYQGTHNLF